MIYKVMDRDQAVKFKKYKPSVESIDDLVEYLLSQNPGLQVLGKKGRGKNYSNEGLRDWVYQITLGTCIMEEGMTPEVDIAGNIWFCIGEN